MMHHHNMHHQPVAGHPGQHINHHGMHAHHQMAPHQMHRDQNRMMGQGVGVRMGNSAPPRGLLPALTPLHHHRPPPPPRHLLHPPQPHTMHPPPGVMVSIGQPTMNVDTKSSLQTPMAMQTQAQPSVPQHPAQQHQMPPPHLAQQHKPPPHLSQPHKPQLQQHQQQQQTQQPTQIQQPTHTQQQPNLTQQPSQTQQQQPTQTQQPAQSQQQQQPQSAPQDLSGGPIILPDLSSSVANSKEKTSMCLVNELARFNKIQHQYRLTSEQGPAHRKRFVVSLRLGGGEGGGPEEEYSAEGSRIRAAQHAVAAEALRRTAYPRPPPRPPRAQRNRRTTYENFPATGAIMPTVELNALTMKLGETAVYTLEGLSGGGNEAQGNRSGQPPFSAPFRPPTLQVQTFNRNSRYYNQNNRFINKYHNTYKEQGAYVGTYYVRLTVGGHIYRGEGSTPQAARHDAASQALRDLKHQDSDENCNADHSAQQSDGDIEDGSCDLKSPVSMVHEIALKFNLPVNFDVKSEKGPPHMKVFITTCTVAEHITEGEGNSKKISKKRAAEKMLEELKKLPSVKKSVTQPDTRKTKRKQQQPKKRTRNLIKEKADSNSNTETNPITRLLQWAMTLGGGREPMYSMVGGGEGTGITPGTMGNRRKGFTVMCEVAGQRTSGTGPSKKLAKRDAAQKMVVCVGVPPVKSKEGEVGVEVVSPSGSVERAGPVAVQATTPPGTSETKGRQLAPGLLLVQDHTPSSVGYFSHNKNGVNPQTTAKIAKELLRAGSSPTADALVKQDHNQRTGTSPNAKPISSPLVSSSTGGKSTAPTPVSPQTCQVIRPKDQLLYLAQLLGFQVQFTDFPKGNHEAFLSLVSLSTQPPLVCHGAGITTDQSHDQCALAALQNLSQMGLDNVTPSGLGHPLPPQTDGHPITNSGSRTNMLTNGVTK